MLLNSLILLFLSNAITSRRDKSILYSRATIILLISAFIPLSLKWSIPHFVILLVFTLTGLSTLLITYNIYYKGSYFNGDIIAQITGNYLFLVDKTISDSVFNDTFLCINIIIGLAMIIIGLLHSRNTMSIKDKFLFIVKNKKKLFIIGLTMLLVISILNMLLFILGLGITVDTSSLTLFLYSNVSSLVT